MVQFDSRLVGFVEAKRRIRYQRDGMKAAVVVAFSVYVLVKAIGGATDIVLRGLRNLLFLFPPLFVVNNAVS